MGREVRKTAPDWQHPKDERGAFEPLLEEEMPKWQPEQATHFQMYENTTEGTPISPVMDSPEALARWLANTRASAFGGRPADYESWLAVCRGEDAVTAVLMPSGRVMSGVEAAKAKPAKERDSDDHER